LIRDKGIQLIGNKNIINKINYDIEVYKKQLDIDNISMIKYKNIGNNIIDKIDNIIIKNN
jgi:hypothetical protein